jgi:hypothetical protein
MPEDRKAEPRKTLPGSAKEKRLLERALFSFLKDPKALQVVNEGDRMELLKIYRDLAVKRLPLSDFNISTWAENVASI